jgi:hypothetical protein
MGRLQVEEYSDEVFDLLDNGAVSHFLRDPVPHNIPDATKKRLSVLR